jgi:C-terminal processing protease CtpA/Prc
MADALLAHEQHGDEDGATDGTAFAVLLSGQMRDVSHDRRLRVTSSLTPVQTTDHPDEPTPEQIARYRSEMERTNCTFEKLEILPHNIGYVKLNSFPHPSVCGANVADAMKSLNQVDEIIFDVRDNGGGFPPMVTTMISYLFDRPTHVNDMYTPRTDLTQHYRTEPMAGNRLADKPAYVLTSASTFSGAEEFSYDLKMLKRAALAGKTTGGGAHPANRDRIDDRFAIDVPFARPTNPISKTDWEGTGVEPDVKVKAAGALAIAEKLAESHLRNR